MKYDKNLAPPVLGGKLVHGFAELAALTKGTMLSTLMLAKLGNPGRNSSLLPGVTGKTFGSGRVIPVYGTDLQTSSATSIFTGGSSKHMVQ